MENPEGDSEILKDFLRFLRFFTDYWDFLGGVRRFFELQTPLIDLNGRNSLA